MAGRALSSVLRIATAEEAARNLRAALETRTAIDLACGMLMAENGCGQEEAIGILRRVSSMRNQKLHDLAEEIISQVSGGQGVSTHFEDYPPGRRREGLGKAKTIASDLKRTRTHRDGQ